MSPWYEPATTTTGASWRFVNCFVKVVSISYLFPSGIVPQPPQFPSSGAPPLFPGPQGMPLPPQGMLLPPQGMPLPPQGMPLPPQGMLLPPQGMPLPPQGMPLPPQGMPPPPQGIPPPPQGSIGVYMHVVGERVIMYNLLFLFLQLLCHHCSSLHRSSLHCSLQFLITCTLSRPVMMWTCKLLALLLLNFN